MAAFHRAAGPARALGRDGAEAVPRPALGAVDPRRAHRFALRARASRRELAGQLLVVWCAAYVPLRHGSGIEAAAAHAVLYSVTWVALFHRVVQAFRAMTFTAGTFVAAAVASAAGVAVLSAAAFWQRALAPRHGMLLVAAAASFAAIGVWDSFVRRAASAPRRVLVVGGGPPTARLLEKIEAERNVALEVVAVVDDRIDSRVARRIATTGGLRDLAATVRRVSPDLVVIAVQRGRPEVFGELLLVAETGFQIAGLPEIYEFTFGRLPVEELTPAWFMSVLHAYNRPASRAGKRAFDIAVALLGIIVSLPLLPVITLVVKRTRGPLLYRQRRLGEHGRMFTMLKFRSMRSDAEAAGAARWATRHDNRIIPGGKLLRKLRLDELPQLWNVLRGEMSIVGPRPERPEFLEFLEREVPFWGQRHLLKPGITGWAQIRSDYAADALATTEKLSYDLWYLRHRSVLLDAIICLRTLPRMATFGGAR
jgi:exopolysaccharide biosynthesis polyprenyl glycosylphosphotransferase